MMDMLDKIRIDKEWFFNNENKIIDYMNNFAQDFHLQEHEQCDAGKMKSSKRKIVLNSTNSDSFKIISDLII